MVGNGLPTSHSRGSLGFGAFYPVAFVVGVAGSGLVGAALVTFPKSAKTDIVALIDTDAYHLWRALIAVLTAFSVATLAVSMPTYRLLRTRYPSSRIAPLNVLYSAVIVVGGVFPAVLGHPDWGWNTLTIRVMILVAAVMAAVWPAVASIWMVRPRGDYLLRCDQQDLISSSKERLEEWRDVRVSLHRMLTLLASVISLTVIVTGQLRNAQIRAGTATTDSFPVSAALLYGAVFAAILAAIYLPVYARWEQAGERLVDTLYPLPPSAGTASDTPALPDQEWEDGRRRLTDFLKLGTTAGAQFKTAFATLAPFLISLIGYFIPAAAT